MIKYIFWTIFALIVLMFAYIVFAETCQEVDVEGHWVYQTEKEYANPTCPTFYHLHNEGNWNQRCHRNYNWVHPEHKAPSCPDGFEQDKCTCSKEVDTSYYVDTTYKEVACPIEPEEPVIEPEQPVIEPTPPETDDSKEDKDERPDLDFTQGPNMGTGDGRVKLKWDTIDDCKDVRIKIADDGVFGNGYEIIETEDDGVEWVYMPNVFWAKIRCDEHDSKYSEVEVIRP